MKKRQLILTLAIAVMMAIMLAGCGTVAMPEKHEIAVPDGYATAHDDLGADSYAGWCDNPETIYFTINDYYNMESEGSLHILTNFETYQQTTEYTCGPCSALMVYNWFGGDTEKYDEMTIADITGTSPTGGVVTSGLVKFFDEIGWDYQANANGEYYYETLEAFEADVIKNIDAGVPMMIAWMDWAGHWEVIIGIDTMQEDNPSDDVLIVADSYDTSDHYQDGYYVIPAERFYYMWNDIFPGDGLAQAFIIAQPAK
jgi:uncharacterized protein YceK